MRRHNAEVNALDPLTVRCPSLVGYRNRLAHALPGDLSSDRIWYGTTADLSRILAIVRECMG